MSSCLDIPHEAARPILSRPIQAQIAFRKIFIPNERHTAFHTELDEMREMVRLTRGEPQSGLLVAAPSGSGKTAGWRAYRSLVLNRETHPEGISPVLYLKMAAKTTPKHLYSQVLVELGDRYADKGTEETLRARACEFMRRAGVELLVADEAQHLITSAGQRTEWRVAEALKALMDGGDVGVVLMGMPALHKLAQANPQFAMRLREPFDYERLDLTRPEHLSFFAKFVGALDDALVTHGIMREPADLLDPFTAACLQDVSQGVIGRVSRLIEVALVIAVRREADRIERHDLALATERWAIKTRLTSYNPFISGAREAIVCREDEREQEMCLAA